MKPHQYSTGEKTAVRHTDCIEGLKALAHGSVNLIVTSPPYPWMRMEYGDRFTEAEYVTFSRTWLTEAVRALTPNGSIWINVGWMAHPKTGRVPLPYLLFPVCRDLGLTFQQEIVWSKPNRPVPHAKRFTTRSERWMWFTKSKNGHTFNLDDVRMPPGTNRSRDRRNHPLGANPTDIWEYAPVNGQAKDRPPHPCPFPVPMIERIVLACSNPGDLVCDPFSGSGSTGVAALRHGRRYVGFEKMAQYVVGSANRLLDEQAREIDRLKGEIERLTANDKLPQERRKSPLKVRTESAAALRHRSAFDLLTTQNAKTPKGESAGFLTGVLYLSPHTEAGQKSLCPNSTPECRTMCLAGSGRIGLPKSKKARLDRTKLFLTDRPAFLARLNADIEKLVEIAARESLTPALRLNGTSDVLWERLLTVPPAVRLYDYTKIPLERRDRPASYHLTYSVGSAEDWPRAVTYLRQGHSVAVVTTPEEIERLRGQSWACDGASGQFVDGDAHDLRFLDPPGSVVLLKPKGRTTSALIRPDPLGELTAAFGEVAAEPKVPIDIAISKARSWNEAARFAGMSVNGQTVSRLRREAARCQIDTCHFTSKPGRRPAALQAAPQ